MRYRALLVLTVSTLAALPVAAQAQDKRVYVSLGGGFTVPNSEIKDHLGNGYNFNFGVQVNVSRAVLYGRVLISPLEGSTLAQRDT